MWPKDRNTTSIRGNKDFGVPNEKGGPNYSRVWEKISNSNKRDGLTKRGGGNFEKSISGCPDGPNKGTYWMNKFRNETVIKSRYRSW